MAEETKFSEDELKSLKNVIYMRIGIGVRYTNLLSKLPAFLYYPIFFSLTLILVPQIRINLSRIYYKIHELRYIFRLFNGLIRK